MNKLTVVLAAAFSLVATASDVHHFSGDLDTGETVNVPESAAVTFTAWVKIDGWGKGEKPFPYVIRTPSFYLHLAPSLSGNGLADVTIGVVSSLGSGGWGFEQVVSTGEWVHVAAAIGKTSGSDGLPALWINGEPANTQRTGYGCTLPDVFCGGTATLGNSGANGGRPFDGYISDVRYETNILSAAEIAALARTTPEGRSPKRVVPVCHDELPVVDLTDDSSRQIVIAAGTATEYQGHPTTLLAPDGKTMFCVWTHGHGGECGPMARSDDGGATWTRIDSMLPSQYAFHRNCPTLQIVPGPDGEGVNFCVFSANCQKNTGGGLGILMSRDHGRSWWVVPPATHLSAGMPPTGLIVLKDGTSALFGQRFKSKDKAQDRHDDDQEVWMSVTKDGGFTWNKPRIVASVSRKNLCEPFAIRSPEGNEIALLMRENRHDSRSMVCFSRDEGRTWTTPVDTCWGLTGDRHEGVLLPDGRLLIAFRDRALGSSTWGQYVAWVGTYDDLRNGRPGQYRIHLLKDWGGTRYGGHRGDTGYSGVEVLPDGMIVCTTYVKFWTDSRLQSVVSVRFRMEETDRKLFHMQKTRMHE